MEELHRRLNYYRKRLDDEKSANPGLVFGGYHIIFSGDFRQIPPVKADANQLLYRNTGLWENAINVAIYLENSHRFKSDPDYGKILMRMWRGEFTKEECDEINKRLIGKNNVILPCFAENDDVAYACYTNSERTTVHATLFEKHIANFPTVSSDEPPPEHTVILEADILKAPKRRPKKKNTSTDNVTLRGRITERIRNLIYAKCRDTDMQAEKKGLTQPLDFTWVLM
jgi:hypothetical protein